MKRDMTAIMLGVAVIGALLVPSAMAQSKDQDNRQRYYRYKFGDISDKSVLVKAPNSRDQHEGHATDPEKKHWGANHTTWRFDKTKKVSVTYDLPEGCYVVGFGPFFSVVTDGKIGNASDISIEISLGDESSEKIATNEIFTNCGSNSSRPNERFQCARFMTKALKKSGFVDHFPTDGQFIEQIDVESSNENLIGLELRLDVLCSGEVD